MIEVSVPRDICSFLNLSIGSWFLLLKPKLNTCQYLAPARKYLSVGDAIQRAAAVFQTHLCPVSVKEKIGAQIVIAPRLVQRLQFLVTIGNVWLKANFIAEFGQHKGRVRVPNLACAHQYFSVTKTFQSPNARKRRVFGSRIHDPCSAQIVRPEIIAIPYAIEGKNHFLAWVANRHIIEHVKA